MPGLFHGEAIGGIFVEDKGGTPFELNRAPQTVSKTVLCFTQQAGRVQTKANFSAAMRHGHSLAVLRPHRGSHLILGLL